MLKFFPSKYMSPIERRDHAVVEESLSFLPTLYPNGLGWLKNTLDENMGSHQTFSMKLIDDQRLIQAIMIVKLKGRRDLKICNFIVFPRYRGNGVGTLLLNDLCERVFDENIDSVSITYNLQMRRSMGDFLMKNYFELKDLVRDKYKPGMSEAVFCRHALSNGAAWL